MNSEEVKTTTQLRDRAAFWTLKEDEDLRRHLEQLADTIESQANGLQDSLAQLEAKLVATQTSIGNAHNRLGLLSNTQFVECRVYDEDEEEEESGVERESQVKAPPG